jgi:hypothetical protein
LHGFRQGLQSFKAPIKNNNIKTLTAPGIDIHLVQQQQSSSKTSFIQLLKTQYQKLSFLNVLHDAEQNETLSYMSGTWKVANFFQMRTMGYGIAEQQTSDDEADCY